MPNWSNKLINKLGGNLRWTAVWGPGVLATLADSDVGNILTAAQGGALWGYRLLGLIFLLIPMLYMVQELTVRLGIFTGQGLTELIRERHGRKAAWCSVLALSFVTIGSLVTELAGVAAVGQIYGVNRSISLSLAAASLWAVVLSGSYRRIEKIALAFGLFELSFLVVAVTVRPDWSVVEVHLADLPVHDHGFMYLVAALVGSVFNPWMLFYQQSATADKGLQPRDYVAAKWDTAVGAVLTQLLTGAVLVAVAATLGSTEPAHALNSIADVSESLIPFLGTSGAHLVFSFGVLGAAMVGAIVSSLALSWSFAEAAGHHQARQKPDAESAWFYRVYASCIAASVILVVWTPDLIGLAVAAQVVNALMLPILVLLLLSLTQTVLPKERRLNGWYLVALLTFSVAVCGAGLYGGLRGIL